MAVAVEGLAATEVEGQLTLFGRLADAIGVLQVVDFAVKLQALTELMPGNQSTSPAAGHVLVADPAAYFSVEADRAEFGGELDRQIVLRPRFDDAATNSAGGIVDGNLRISPEREIQILVR